MTTINPRVRTLIVGGRTGHNVQVDLTNGLTMSICVGYGNSGDQLSEVAFWSTADQGGPFVAPADFPVELGGDSVYGWVPHEIIRDYIDRVGYFLRDGFIISGIQKTPPKELMP